MSARPQSESEWLNHFTRWAQEHIRLRHEPRPRVDCNSLDLSINPVVKVAPAYDSKLGGYRTGAEVTLQDGAVFRWDAFHGGGYWYQKLSGRLTTAGLSWHTAIHRVIRATRSSEAAISAAKFGNEDAALRHWVECDSHTQHAAVYALMFLLSWDPSKNKG